MKIEFFHTPTFKKNAKALAKKHPSLKDDFDEFVKNIGVEPSSDLGRGLRKYRLAVKSKNKGKSGGFRIITLEIIADLSKKCTFLTMYDKSEQDNISKSDINDILNDL